MMHLSKHFIVFSLIGFILVGCSSSEPAISSESSSGSDDLATAETIESTEPDKQIIVFINGRVKYSFTKQDTSWIGTATQFDSNEPETRKIVTEFELQPTYGWSDFEEMVKFLNIYDMPDQAEIEDRKVGKITPQSRSYLITVFDGENSRTYSYFNPEEESKDHWQSQQISTFGSYIVTEMKVVETVNN